MSRFRMIVAAVVVVAMMSIGAAACTPADQAQFENNAQNLLAGALYVLFVNLFVPPCPPAPAFCPPFE